MPLTRIDSAFLDLDAIGGIDFDVQSGVPTFTVDATTHRVGIGTDAPNYTAQVNRIGGNTDVMQVKGNTGNSFIRFTDSNASSDYSLGADDAISNGFILYDRNASEYRVVVNSTGNVGIGTNSPSQKLSVNGNAILLDSGELFFADGTNQQTASIKNGASSNTSQLQFFTSSNERMRIGSSGTISIGDLVSPASANIHLDLYCNSSYDAFIRFRDESGAPGLIGFDHGSNAMQFYTNGSSEAMRIDSSGIVKIGTANAPSAKVLIGSSSNNNFGQLQLQTSGQFLIGYGSTHPFQPNELSLKNGVGDLTLYTDGNEQLRIDSSGNVGIGTNNPIKKVDIYNGSTDSDTLRVYNDEVGINMGTWGTGSSYPRTVTINGTRFDAGTAPKLRIGGQGGIEFAVDLNNVRAVINTSGNVGIGTNNPQALLQLGSRTSASPQGVLHIVRGETIGGGTGPSISLIHGPDGGTQRSHQIYSFVGDLRIAADSNENMELHTGGSLSQIITSGGNVGIGNNNPQSKLQIENDGEQLRLTYPSIASYIHEVKSNGDYAIDKDGTERLRITSGGYVGINLDVNASGNATLTPWTNLHVVGANVADGVAARNNATPTGQLHVSSTGWGHNQGGTISLGSEADNVNPNAAFGSISARREGTLSYQYAGYLAFNTSNGSNLNERLRIGSNGRLSIKGSTANMEYLRMGGNNDRGLRFTSSSGTSSVGVVHTINAPGDGGAQGEIVFQTNSGERLRVDANGNVGIGTNDPVSKLHISGDSGTLLRLDGGASGTGTRDIIITEFNQPTYGGIIRYHSVEDRFTFGTLDNSNVIDAINVKRNDGNVGIGTTNPAVKLQVDGSDVEIRASNNSNSKNISLYGGSSSNDPAITFTNALRFYSNSAGNERMRIDSSGNVGIGTNDPGSHKLSVRNGDLYVTGNSNTDYDYIGGIQVGNGVSAPTLATFDNNQTTNYKRLNLASLHAGDVHLRSFWGVSVDINDGQLGDSGSASQARIPSTSSFTVNRRSGNGAFSTLFAVRNSGNVGISTDNPTAKLQVQGTSYITSKLSVGISQFTDNAGLTVSASGAKFFNDSLWMQPAGNVLFSARGGSGDDNWIGIGGYYNVTGGSSNILLQANFSNTSTGAGHAIRSIATGTGAQDFKIQRVYAAASTSGRPTYTDILTINNDGVLAFYTGANGSSNERFRINNHGNSIFQSQAPSATNGITGNAGLLIRGKTVDGSSTTVDLNISQSASTNGVHLEIQENSNNANALASLVFNHGSLKAMIATSRVATTNWGTDLRFYTHDDSTASANQHKVYERLRITSSGNVGIGTTNPGAKLEVNGGNARFGRSGLSILVRNSLANTSGATLPATFVACTTDGGSNTAIVYWNQNYGSNQNQGCLGAVTATDTIVSPNTSVTYGCTIYGVVGRY